MVQVAFSFKSQGIEKLNFSPKELRNVKILNVNVSLLLIPNILKFPVLLY